MFSWGKRKWSWQRRNEWTLTSELLITRIFITALWCEGKRTGCTQHLYVLKMKNDTDGARSLSPAPVDLRLGPGVKDGRRAITMLLVFAPQISLLQTSYFPLFSDPVKSRDAASKSSALEKSSGCTSQLANGKCKRLSFTNYQSRKSLWQPSSWSLANSFSLSK